MCWQSPSQLPLMAVLLDSSEYPIKLIQYALSLLQDEEESTQNPIIHSESSPLTCQVLKREKKVFAGSLILAKDTVCLLGELTNYKRDALNCIKSGDIFIASGRRQKKQIRSKDSCRIQISSFFVTKQCSVFLLICFAISQRGENGKDYWIVVTDIFDGVRERSFDIKVFPIIVFVFKCIWTFQPSP